MSHKPATTQASTGADPALQGWSQRLGMSFEEFEAVIAGDPAPQGAQQDDLPLLAPDIAAGFVC